MRTSLLQIIAELHGKVWFSWTNMATHKLSRVSNCLPLQYFVVKGHLLSKTRIEMLQAGRLFAKIPHVAAMTDALVEWSSRATNCRHLLCCMSNDRRDYEQPMDALRPWLRMSSISTMLPRRRRTSLWSSLCFVAWTALVHWHARVRAVTCR